MKLTIKNTLNGVVVSTVSATFNEVSEYVAFLAKFDVQIDDIDAAMDMHQEEVEMTLPTTSVSNDLGQDVSLSSVDESLMQQLEFNFNENAVFEERSSAAQVDLYAKKH